LEQRNEVHRSTSSSALTGTAPASRPGRLIGLYSGVGSIAAPRIGKRLSVEAYRKTLGGGIRDL
jgi:hypothetical protein